MSTFGSGDLKFVSVRCSIVKNRQTPPLFNRISSGKGEEVSGRKEEGKSFLRLDITLTLHNPSRLSVT